MTAPVIYVLLSEDGLSLRKWSLSPFEGGVEYRPVAAPAAGRAS